MKKLPFEIPESLKSYVVTFGESQAKGIANLEQYLARRRIDAVGYFLLAVLYNAAERPEDAKSAANKARALAPGSKIMEQLQYFLTHPDGFNAWIPDNDNQVAPAKSLRKQDRTEISIDLETLISRLTKASGKRIKIKDEPSVELFQTEGVDAGELATPTLAKIYERQGKIEEAIRVYQKLIAARPAEAPKFKKEITKLLTRN